MSTEGEWANVCNRLIEEKKAIELQIGDNEEELSIRARTIEALELQVRELQQIRDRAVETRDNYAAKLEQSNRLNEELTKKGEALCQQAGWALVVLNRLLSLHQLDVAKDGDHPEFCDCAWCRTWGDVREVTGRSLRPVCAHEGKYLDVTGTGDVRCMACQAVLPSDSLKRNHETDRSST